MSIFDTEVINKFFIQLKHVVLNLKSSHKLFIKRRD